jgi:tRNA-dihydrouridine synthase
VRIPVIGNGDIRTAEDVRQRLQTSRVRGVMIGRGAMASPWVFRQTKALLAGLTPPPEPTLQERWTQIVRHCEMAAAEGDSEPHTMASLRAHLMAYSRGMPGGRQLRSRFQQVTRVDEIRRLAEEHLTQAPDLELAEPA